MSIIKLANQLDDYKENSTNKQSVLESLKPTSKQKSVDNYYDHVPSSSMFGSVVGGAMGVPAGLVSGIGLNRMAGAVKASRSIPKLKKRVDILGEVNGFSPEQIDLAVSKIPTAKKIIGGSAGIGAAIGSVDGAYRGAMTGVGMNDRQYLLGENISNDNLVYNSRSAALNMNSRGGRISNIYNDRFGKNTGALRRMFNEESKDRIVKE